MSKQTCTNEQLITDLAQALYEGSDAVYFATDVANLLSIAVPPLSRFLDAISDERDRLAMNDAMDEMAILRGNR